MIPLYVHGKSDVGRQRERNEDCLRILPRGSEGRLLMVCDGMGGHGGGHIASDVAATTIAAHLPAAPLGAPPAKLYEALRAANQAVHEAAHGSADPAMGTTAVVAWLEGSRCWCGWVGDSRLYWFRGGEQIERTVDHTRVQQMVERGILTPAQARHHPEGHILTQAIGGGGDVHPSVWNEPMELIAGDVLLMCSDGLYDLIDDDEMYPMIAGRPYQEAVERLVGEANRRGGTDNITVLLCIVGQPEVPPLPTGYTPPQRGGSDGGGWRMTRVLPAIALLLGLAGLAIASAAR